MSTRDGLSRRPVCDPLSQMNDRFTAAVETAFRAGLESPAAARATVRVGCENGSRLLEEAAIGGAWRWFVDAKFQATAVEVLARVRASCASVTAERVREGFWRRLVETRC